MPILSRNGIHPELRKPYDKKYKALLKEALANPGLSADQRARIKSELDQVGQPRVYDAALPPVPGAIDLNG